MRVAAPTAIAAVIITAACSSSHAARHTSAPASTPPQRFTTDYGQDAATDAAHIPGCTGVAAGSIGEHGAAGGMVATASCTLDGHTVIIDTWRDEASMPDIATLAKGDHATWAQGTGWTAIIADDGATPQQTTLQMQLTNNASGLLDESTNGDQYPPSAAAGAVLPKVADALSGVVKQS